MRILDCTQGSINRSGLSQGPKCDCENTDCQNYRGRNRGKRIIIDVFGWKQPGKGITSMYLFLLSSLAIGSTVIIVLTAVWYVLTVMGDWKIFEKAGEKPWKSIIPYLNTYTEYTLAWKGVYGVAVIICSLITSYYGRVANTYRVYMAETAQESTVVAVPAAPSKALTIVALIAAIALLVMNILKAKNLAAAFGKSTLFAVGLFFFEPIFRVILGFGKDKYIGPMGDPDQEKSFS